MLLREWRDLPVEYDAEACGSISSPHDVERFRPGALASSQRGSAAIIGSSAHGRRAIAEGAVATIVCPPGQSVEPEGQGANFDRNERQCA
jgi:hypothetical protein